MGKKFAAFAVIMLASSAIGLLFKLGSSQVIELPAQSESPAIEVYVSDPSASVQLTLGSYSEVTPGKDFGRDHPGFGNQFSINLGITPSSPGRNVDWIIYIRGENVRINLNSAYDFKAGHNIESGIRIGTLPSDVPGGEETPYIFGTTRSLQEVPIAQPRIPENANLSGVASVAVAEYEVSNSAGYAAALPTVAFEANYPNWSPLERSTVLLASANASPVKLLDHTEPDDIVHDYLREGMHVESFYSPASLHSSSILGGAQSLLAGSRIDVLLPANAAIEDGAMVWNSDTQISPRLESENIAYADGKVRADFKAALAFAIAAAALIAAIQELEYQPSREITHPVDDEPYGGVYM